MTIEDLKESFKNDIRTKSLALDAINQLEKANAELSKENTLLKSKLDDKTED